MLIITADMIKDEYDQDLAFLLKFRQHRQVQWHGEVMIHLNVALAI